jgi:hypothetical protein
MFDRVSSFTTTLNSNRKFNYPAINRKTREIRLLQFLGNSRDKDVRCKLVIKNLDDMPTFKALSYIWGDDSMPSIIYRPVNGANIP